jgi:hypothetical protein
MDGYMIPLLVVATAPQQSRSRIAETILPLALPVAPSQRLGVAAVAASQQVSDAQRREERAVSETVNVIGSAISTSRDPDFSTSPTLRAVVDRAAQVGQQITALVTTTGIAQTDAIETTIRSLGGEAVKVIKAAINNPEGTLFTEDQLRSVSLEFLGVLKTLPDDVQAQILQPPVGIQAPPAQEAPAQPPPPAKAKGKVP